MNDDITVVIPCFNSGRYVSEAVESALLQDGGAPRVVVVDDGSNESETVNALTTLPPAVRVVRQPNRGVAAARNHGLSLAQTQFLIALDADDRLAANALQLLRRVLLDDSRIAFSYGSMCFFGAWDGVLEFPPYDPYGLLYRHTIGVSALMRRELFERVGGFDRAFAGYEDWEFWIHALALGLTGRKVDDVTVHYRRSQGGRHMDARPAYRATFRQLRHKHAALYAGPAHRVLAASSSLNLGQRLLCRLWWGPRPLPASVEIMLQRMLWRPKGRQREGTTRS